MALGEFDLIHRFFQRELPAGGAVRVGIGDDCAVLAPSPGHDWLVSCDTLVEGRHFLSSVAPDRLGHKALAVNLSDLAACGATPRAFFLGLTLPRSDPAWLEDFARGLLRLADAHGIVLAGGDTTAGPLSVQITVMGEAPCGQALLRSGAQVGDDVYVSGQLGDARLALEVFRGRLSLGGEAFEAVRHAMEQPAPRVALGQALRGLAHSAIDLSDGLVGDLGHILTRSGVGATLDAASLPCSAVLAAQPEAIRHECLLGGGDDYELLFTAPPSRRAAIAHAAERSATPVTHIGRIDAEPGLRVQGAASLPRGFDHFAA